VADGGTQRVGDGQLHGHAGLHVARTAAPDDVPAVQDAAVRRQIVLDGHRVEVPRDQHALVASQTGAGDQRVAVAHDLQIRALTCGEHPEDAFDRVRDPGFVTGD